MRLGKKSIAAGTAAGIVSLAVLGAVIAPAVASAQDSAPDATATADHEREGCGLRAHGGARLDGLAAAIGVPADELQAALIEVRDALHPEGRPAEPPSAEEREAMQAAFQAALAGALNVTVEEIAAAFESLRPSAEEIEARRAATLEQMTDRLAQAVENGRITQEQADNMLERVSAGEHQGRGFGFRGRGHFGFGHGFPQGGMLAPQGTAF